MLKTPKAILTTALLLLTLTAPALLSQSAHALFSGATSQACSGINTDASGPTACQQDQGGLNNTLGTIINILSLIVGVAAVIMLIVGGLMYVLSGGDANRTKAARSTIISALVGLMIVALAETLVHFVLSTTTNATACPTNPKISASDPSCKST